jgi:hypothetical protein
MEGRVGYAIGREHVRKSMKMSVSKPDALNEILTRDLKILERVTCCR